MSREKFGVGEKISHVKFLFWIKIFFRIWKISFMISARLISVSLEIDNYFPDPRKRLSIRVKEVERDLSREPFSKFSTGPHSSFFQRSAVPFSRNKNLNCWSFEFVPLLPRRSFCTFRPIPGDRKLSRCLICWWGSLWNRCMYRIIS